MGSLVKNARDLKMHPELKNQLWLNAFGMVILHFVHVQVIDLDESRLCIPSDKYLQILEINQILIIIKNYN